MLCGQAAAALMRHLCECPRHGYTQGSGRWGSEAFYCQVEEQGRTWFVADGDRDCSSAVIDCWKTVLAATPRKGAIDGATYTGNMRKAFVGSGLFDWHPMGDGYAARAGDVYLNEASHTAMCLRAVPDVLGEFSINEFGGITGGAVGDQTGGESRVAAYYPFPWDGILAYNGGADEEERVQDMTGVIFADTDTGAWRYWEPFRGFVGIANLDEAEVLKQAGCPIIECNEGYRIDDRAADLTERALSETEARIAALEGAVEGLASAMGADPEAIASAVSEAVSRKLSELSVDVTFEA